MDLQIIFSWRKNLKIMVDRRRYKVKMRKRNKVRDLGEKDSC